MNKGARELDVRDVACIAARKLSILRAEMLENAGDWAESDEFNCLLDVYERLGADPRIDEAYSALAGGCTASQVRCFILAAVRAAGDAPGFGLVRDELMLVKRLKERIIRAASTLSDLLCEAHDLAGLEFNVCGGETIKLIEWPDELFHPPNVFHLAHFADLRGMFDRRRQLYAGVGLSELCHAVSKDLSTPPCGWTLRYEVTQDGSTARLELLNNKNEIICSVEGDHHDDPDDADGTYDPWVTAIMQDVDLVNDIRSRAPQNLWIIDELLRAVKKWSPEASDETVAAAIGARERNRKMELLRAFWSCLMGGIEWEQALADTDQLRRAVLVAANIILNDDTEVVEPRDVNDVARRYEAGKKAVPSDQRTQRKTRA